MIEIKLKTNLNALQLTLIALQEQLKIERQRSLIDDNIETNVKDLEDFVDSIKKEILNNKK